MQSVCPKIRRSCVQTVTLTVAFNLDECNMKYLFAMRHGHETCKIVDWQFGQSQAEKLGQHVTILNKSDKTVMKKQMTLQV